MAHNIKSTNTIKCYEESEGKNLVVKEHWNNRNLVVIVVGDDSFTVAASDLRKAIENAQNCHTS